MKPDRYMVWDIVKTARGPIELNRRIPSESKGITPDAPDWCATAIEPGLSIGETFITEAGWVRITAKARGAYEDPPPTAAGGLPAGSANTPPDDRPTAGGGVIPENAHTPMLPRQIEAQLEAEIAAAKVYAKASKADNTLDAYETDWRLFKRWCQKRSFQTMPADPDTVSIFLASQARAGLKPSTLERRLAAIRFFHEAGQMTAPQDQPGLLLKSVMSGIRRTEGYRPEPRLALSREQLFQILDTIERRIDQQHNNRKLIRDYTLFLVGFASALRGGELAALDLDDVEFFEDGMILTIRKAKDDQEGHGRSVRVPRATEPHGHCPLSALQYWIRAAEIIQGPLFRQIDKTGAVKAKGISRDYIRKLLKSYARQSGFSDEDVARLGSHSLRRGWTTEVATSMVRSGQVDKQSIMDHLGHSSEATTNRYIDGAEGFESHPGRQIF